MLNYKNIVQLTQQINNNELHKNGMSTKLSTMHENHNISWLFFQEILRNFSQKKIIYTEHVNFNAILCDFPKKICGRKRQQQFHKQTTPSLNQLLVNNLLPFLELIFSISPTTSHHILLYSIQELSWLFNVNFGPVTSNRVWLLLQKQAYATSLHCHYSLEQGIRTHKQ